LSLTAPVAEVVVYESAGKSWSGPEKQKNNNKISRPQAKGEKPPELRVSLIFNNTLKSHSLFRL
jgi:hypothetical protein